MSRIFIIHGAYGSPKVNWIPWLESELKKLKMEVFVPTFPTPEQQNLVNWTKAFEEYKKYLDENSVFVGHSLGPAFIMSVIESLKQPIFASFLVSGFTGLLGLPEFDNINRTISDRSFNYERIKNNCKEFYIYNSDTDPYVPLDKGEQLAKELDGTFILVKNGGHINAEAGYIKFPQLLEDIKKCLGL